jgi:hypothetical protein
LCDHCGATQVLVGALVGALVCARPPSLADIVLIVGVGRLYGVLFPLLFLSGTYMPISSPLLNRVTGWLPIRPFSEALTGPLSRHAGADWRHLAVLGAWGVIGAIVAIRRFRWDPRPE